LSEFKLKIWLQVTESMINIKTVKTIPTCIFSSSIVIKFFQIEIDFFPECRKRII
jgi:hypothetical protein